MKFIVTDLESQVRSKLDCDKIIVLYRLRKDGVTIEIECPGCFTSRECKDFFSKFGFIEKGGS